MPSSRGPGRNVFLLGLTSFLADVASDMVMPLLPAFIATLGGGAASIGAIEGAAEVKQDCANVPHERHSLACL